VDFSKWHVGDRGHQLRQSPIGISEFVVVRDNQCIHRDARALEQQQKQPRISRSSASMKSKLCHASVGSGQCR